ncbi:MAG: allantoinase AllB [Gemmatimonadaceae bacterium]
MARAPDLILRGQRVVTPDGVRPAAIHVRDGVIVNVARYEDVPPRMRVDEAGNAVVMPGLVDTHVHMNDPGRADWEGCVTATRAAAAGGVTTLVDMPLNSIPATTTRDALLAKEEAAADRVAVDVAFWGGVVPGNTDELAALHLAGVVGFKCFLCPSGVDEFPPVTEDDLREAMPELARLGAPLLVHAELPSRLAPAPSFPPEEARECRRYRHYLRTRPPEAEIEAVELLIRLSREYGTAVHIVHLSAAAALPALAAARAESLPVTVETCPHYLHFCAEEVKDGATTLKCAPPIRDAENRDRLWRALGDGDIDMVVSDHSPCPPGLKERHSGSFARAWGGISSLQVGLSVVWTGARARGHSIEELARWMCAAPAALAGLGGRKGAIAVGRDADLVLWHPEQPYRVEPTRLQHRHAITPYGGAMLHGVVEATYLRGMKVFEQDDLFGPPAGLLLTRDAP